MGVKFRNTGLTVNVDDSVSDRIDGQIKTSLQNYLNKFDADLDIAESTYYRPENVRDTIVSLTPIPIDGWYLVEGATVAPLDVENNNLVLIESGAISDHYTPKEGDRIVLAGVEQNFLNGNWFSSRLKPLYTGSSTIFLDSVNGSDETGDGTSGNRFKTIDYVLDYLDRFDMSAINTVVFSLTTGSYPVDCQKFNQRIQDYNSFGIIGAGRDNTTLVASNRTNQSASLEVDSNSNLADTNHHYYFSFEKRDQLTTFFNLTIDQATGESGNNDLIRCTNQAAFTSLNIRIAGDSYRFCIFATEGGLIHDFPPITNSLKFSNDFCQAYAVAMNGGIVSYPSMELDFLDSTNPANFTHFVRAEKGGKVILPPNISDYILQSGEIGSRFLVKEGGTLLFGDGSVEVAIADDFLPGNQAGTIQKGGIYNNELKVYNGLFRSNPVVYVNDSQLNFAHGWSNFDPATDAYLEQVYAICTTAADGFAVGDVVSIKTRRGTTKITSTLFVVIVEDTGFRYTRADTQTESNIDANNWKIFVVGVWL